MEKTICKITNILKEVGGIDAIVLGGSRAKGNHYTDSDIDIGLYYNKETIDFSILEEKAQELDMEHRENLLARPGEWGKWQNGGCWLAVDNIPVDLILRDTDRVKFMIEECKKGIVTAHYQTGHPHAYFNTMYMGELAISKVLWSENNEILKLKAISENYPLEMKKEIINLFSFEMSFSLMLAEKNIRRCDVYYVIAHIVRSVSAINQVLFALNEIYCINEKQAVAIVSTLNICPSNYKERIDSIFSLSNNLELACKRLSELIEEVKNFL